MFAFMFYVHRKLRGGKRMLETFKRIANIVFTVASTIAVIKALKTIRRNKVSPQNRAFLLN